MSLLDTGPHTVEVFVPTVVGRDRANNNRLEYDWDNPIVFRGVSVQSANVQAFGQQENNGVVDTRRVLRLRDEWPGGPYTIVRWDGRLWDQDGEHRRFSMGRRTQHSLVRLRARWTEVK